MYLLCTYLNPCQKRIYKRNWKKDFFCLGSCDDFHAAAILQNTFEAFLIPSRNTHESPLKHQGYTIKAFVKHPQNFLGMPLKLLEKTYKYSWNTFEISFNIFEAPQKHLSFIFLKTSFNYPSNINEAPVKYTWNAHETLWKFPYSNFETSLNKSITSLNHLKHHFNFFVAISQNIILLWNIFKISSKHALKFFEIP